MPFRPSTHPGVPDLSVSIPMHERLSGQGARATSDDVVVTTTGRGGHRPGAPRPPVRGALTAQVWKEPASRVDDPVSAPTARSTAP